MAVNSPQKLAQAFYEVISTAPASAVSGIAKKFVGYLANKRLLKKAPQILEQFERISKAQAGIKEVTVTTARELDEKALHNITKAFGKKIESKVLVNAEILGGFLVASGDLIFDATVKTQLKNLKIKLVN
ncbi:MAG: ATP synthase F1 subunit delta [Candidatus Magasanikbacteria bacterium]|nr:ATP synthase F1 subunit delta [Candidatus Magasanikbacteria bacterium]